MSNNVLKREVTKVTQYRLDEKNKKGSLIMDRRVGYARSNGTYAKSNFQEVPGKNG